MEWQNCNTWRNVCSYYSRGKYMYCDEPNISDWTRPRRLMFGNEYVFVFLKMKLFDIWNFPNIPRLISHVRISEKRPQKWRWWQVLETKCVAVILFMSPISKTSNEHKQDNIHLSPTSLWPKNNKNISISNMDDFQAPNRVNYCMIALG